MCFSDYCCVLPSINKVDDDDDDDDDYYYYYYYYYCYYYYFVADCSLRRLKRVLHK